MSMNGPTSGAPNEARERPAWLIPAVLVTVITVLSGAILLYYFGPAPDLLLSSTGGPARSERIFEARIGDNSFRIRERYVRAIVENNEGEVATIDLHVAWPIQLVDPPDVDLSRPRLLDPADALYLTIAPARAEFDAARRLKELYPTYVSGPAEDAGDGLVRLSMKPGSGYDDQDVFVAGEGERQFIARCFRKKEDEAIATCVRDRVTDRGLSIRYRFNRDLLASWQQLEAGVAAFLEQLRQE